ncbi:MAG: C-GCAxxG-C-C family protein [Candidatus Heimdallarchaeota archaeon]
MSKINQIDYGKQAQSILLKSKSCALTQIKLFQEILDNHDDEILNAVSGLSGGILSKGSTCGVVFSGALSLAMLLDSKVVNWTKQHEITLHDLISDYTNWFEEKYKSTLCRDRIKLDLWTVKGVAKLLLPQKIIKCLSHTKGSMRYLSSKVEEFKFTEIENDTISNQSYHCARTVLERIRNATSIGNAQLEKISIAFDGGVGLQGGACGALAGAIMALNLHTGSLNENIENKKQSKNYLSYPLKNRKKENIEKKPIAYQAKELVEKFLKVTNSLECKNITNKRFSNWNEFQNYREKSQICETLIDLTSNEVINYIKLEFI